jgi:hypothetical protein
MKITVDLPDSELKEICVFTGEKKKGPAIRKMVTDALMMKRREMLSQKFISGEWGVDLATFEQGKSQDRRASKKRDEKWRGK